MAQPKEDQRIPIQYLYEDKIKPFKFEHFLYDGRLKDNNRYRGIVRRYEEEKVAIAEGNGELTFANNISVHKGYFLKNKPNGLGIFYDGNALFRFGNFVNGELAEVKKVQPI